MMNILINFSTLKAGGGQNVALNFLYAIQSRPMDDLDYWYLVAKDSEPHRYLAHAKSKKFIVAPRNALLRILFEFFLGWHVLRRHRIDIVYSYFGYAWFPKRWPQVSGSADSNLYFPEIDFWSGYRGFDRLKLRLKDGYRLCGVRRANAVVFENEAMEKRGRTFFGIRLTKTIKPSICFSDTAQKFTLPSHGAGETAKKGLFLCGWHLNKNIMLIPPLAAEMRERKRAFVFILTAPLDNSTLHRQFCELVRKHGVEDRVLVVGPVKKDELSSLYDQIDFVFLLSKLESFSNNIIEAWHFRKPLIVADELWAKSICQDAAVYVARDSKVDIADRLYALLDSDPDYQGVINRGSDMLKNYPTIQERVNQELDYIRYVHQNS